MWPSSSKGARDRATERERERASERASERERAKERERERAGGGRQRESKEGEREKAVVCRFFLNAFSYHVNQEDVVAALLEPLEYISDLA